MGTGVTNTTRPKAIDYNWHLRRRIRKKLQERAESTLVVSERRAVLERVNSEPY